MSEVDVAAAVVFSGLSPLIIEGVEDEGTRIVVRTRTTDRLVSCPDCGVGSRRVHGHHLRTVADLPLDGRPVMVRVRVRRLLCSTAHCRISFREQVPGVLERYQRRTARLTAQVWAVVRELAGRASARLLATLRIHLSRHTAIRCLLRIPLPSRPVPAVLGVDDFALRRRHRYASVVINAATHERVDVLPDRKSDTLAAWITEHPGVEIVVRDGSTTCAEAVRRSVPAATQVSDRWHLWHGLARAAEKLVAAHSGCWAKAGPPRRTPTREQTTLERWHAVHDLLKHGVGLLDCSRRLGLSLNTVKRYARVPEPQRLRRPPQYRACLVDGYRDHLRVRRAAEPGVPVQSLFDEITKLGYTGGLNLLYKDINQGRLDGDRIMPSPRRRTRWLLTKRANLTTGKRAHLDELLAACPETTALANAVHAFAHMMSERHGDQLDHWISQVRAASLVELEPFLTGLEQDHDAAVAGLTLPHSSGPVEGINTKTKLIKRQMYGRAGFPLLRHRILLG